MATVVWLRLGKGHGNGKYSLQASLASQLESAAALTWKTPLDYGTIRKPSVLHSLFCCHACCSFEICPLAAAAAATTLPVHIVFHAPPKHPPVESCRCSPRGKVIIVTPHSLLC